MINSCIMICQFVLEPEHKTEQHKTLIIDEVYDDTHMKNKQRIMNFYCLFNSLPGFTIYIFHPFPIHFLIPYIYERTTKHSLKKHNDIP